MKKPKALNKSIAILGAGSWGTAVAVHLANSHYPVLLWGRASPHMERTIESGNNEDYLPGITLPSNITVTTDFNHCLEKADFLIIAVPSLAFKSTLSKIKKAPASGIAWLTKGLEPTTHHFFHEIVEEQFGKDYPMAIISGPSFAQEVALGLPTAITIAGNNKAYLDELHELLHHRNLRVYLSQDLLGIQLCGAIKNVLAIACGISDGLGFGANARAALITRGLAEMKRLGMSLGAKEQTFMGLAGVGDLVLTCTDDQSRNRRFGLFIGKGMSTMDAKKAIDQVIEGVDNAKQVCQLAKDKGIDMPICSTVLALLQNETKAEAAVLALMGRARSEE